jgi:hypothetical protein
MNNLLNLTHTTCQRKNEKKCDEVMEWRHGGGPPPPRRVSDEVGREKLTFFSRMRRHLFHGFHRFHRFEYRPPILGAIHIHKSTYYRENID